MEYAEISKAGDREINEDSLQSFQVGNKMVFVLADGLGGHGYGEIASKEAVEAVKKHFISNSEEEIHKLLQDSFQVAHNMLKKLQNEVHDDSFFKTTMAIVVIGEDYVIWGHIGDSRIYHFEEGCLIERSMDHSVPQMLFNTGAIREKQIRHHEDRNRLTRVLGSDEENSKPFITIQEPRNEDAAFLLCSDGFWEFVPEKTMIKTLHKSADVGEWLRAMEKRALKNGKKYNMDNYSAIAVKL